MIDSYPAIPIRSTAKAELSPSHPSFAGQDAVGFLWIFVMAGWIKIHRKIVDSVVSSDPVLGHIWLQLLVRANYEQKQLSDGTFLDPGDLLISQRHFAAEIGIGRQQLRTALDKLKKCGNLTHKVTHAGTHISICNWRVYQDDDRLANPATNPQLTHSQPTANPQLTHSQPTNKEKKKEKKARREKTTPQTPQGDSGAVLSFFESWNEKASNHPQLSQCRTLTERRAKLIGQRLADPYWAVAVDDALSKLPLPTTKGVSWQPDLDWLIKCHENLMRLADGAFNWRADGDDRGLVERKLAELRGEA